MAALTLTPKSTDDQTVYSDGTTSNKITIGVQQNGSPLVHTALAGTLVDSAQSIAGFLFPGSTDANGDITFAVPATIAGQLTLTLLLDDQTTGSMAITAIVFEPVTFQKAPSYAQSATAVRVTANIADSTNTPVDGVPLTWHVHDTRLNIHDTTSTTDGQDPLSFVYDLPILTDEELDALAATGVDLQLIIGSLAGDFIIAVPIPVNPPLLAPTLLDTQRIPPVIDDDLIAACTEDGIAFYIPIIANTSPDDFVTLVASPTGSSNDSKLLAMRKLDQASIGKALLMLAPVDNQAFETNGPVYIYYNVMRSQLQNSFTASEMLLVQIDRQDPSIPPDGNPVTILTAPHVSHIVYTLDNCTNKDSMTVEVDFTGDFVATLGDLITVKIYLLGYTQANMNEVKTIQSVTYQLRETDFDENGVCIPVPFTFTADQFEGVDGSDGQVYYLVKQYVKIYRSPSRSIVVDTVPAYSGS
jgi:hypothetical protein